MTNLIHRHLKHLKVGGRSPNTIYDRGRVLVRVDAELPWGVEDADGEEIADWFDGRKWSPATRACYWMHLCCFYDWAVAEPDGPTLNPMSRLIRPPAAHHLPDPVTDDELALAINRSPEQPYGLAAYLGSYAGLRCGEIAALQREDITEQRVFVRHGKGDRPRYVDTSPILWERVKDMPHGVLIRGKRGRPIGGRTLTQEQHRHWVSVDLPRVHLHRFRHWFATTLLVGGADIRSVQELMGHASLATTERYLKVVDKHRRAAVRLLPMVVARAGA
jgi:integrase